MYYLFCLLALRVKKIISLIHFDVYSVSLDLSLESINIKPSVRCYLTKNA
jgi:hypothetical protein